MKTPPGLTAAGVIFHYAVDNQHVAFVHISSVAHSGAEPRPTVHEVVSFDLS